MAQQVKYRADIDGLRAVAVISVVLFHLGVPWVPAGFVGVDIFFVISGYLISTILFAETAAGRFSVWHFYERRARRILPALFATMAATAVAAYMLLFPSELVGFARSLLAATLFSANIYFYASLDYFAPAAERLPLLHLWSLGVEEQFYLVFPLLLLALARTAARARSATLVLLGLASFGLSAVLTRGHPTAAFYLLPFRAFELLIGACLAIPGVAAPRRRAVAVVAAVAGAAAMIGAIVGLNRTTVFPGVAAALPCLGAGLLIWAGAWANPAGFQAGPSRLLGARPVAAIGRISYSLYLVHWPIIVFGTQMFPDARPGLRQLGMAAAAIALAVASFVLVEQPVRRGARLTRATILASGLCGMVVFCAAAQVTIANAGFPQRYGAKLAAVLDYLHYNPTVAFREGACFLRPEQGYAALDQKLCFPAGAPRTALLWGDSTAAHLYAGLAGVMRARGFALGQATASACAPIADYDAPDRPHCREFNGAVLAHVLAQPPDLVVLASSWAIAPQIASADLAPMLARLRAARVRIVIIGPAPYYDTAVPRILADRLQSNDHDVLSGKRMLPAPGQFDAAMLRVAGRAEVPYVSLLRLFCPGGQCPLTTPDGTPMEFDVLHLTLAGSRFVAPRIAAAILR